MLDLVEKKESPSQEDKNNARLLWAIGDPARLNIIHELVKHEGNWTVFQLVDRLWLKQPTISHHLRILYESGVVDYHQKGLEFYYFVVEEKLQQAQDIIEGLKSRKYKIDE